MAYRRPPLAVFIEHVERYDKRIGLRMLYKEFEVPAESRPAFRDMWDKIAEEINHASRKQGAEADDGDSQAPAGETVRSEPGGPENEQGPTPRLRGDKGKGPEKPSKKKEAKKKKPKQSASKT